MLTPIISGDAADGNQHRQSTHPPLFPSLLVPRWAQTGPLVALGQVPSFDFDRSGPKRCLPARLGTQAGRGGQLPDPRTPHSGPHPALTGWALQARDPPKGGSSPPPRIQVHRGRFQSLLTPPKWCFAHFPRGTCMLSVFHLCI